MPARRGRRVPTLHRPLRGRPASPARKRVRWRRSTGRRAALVPRRLRSEAGLGRRRRGAPAARRTPDLAANEYRLRPPVLVPATDQLAVEPGLHDALAPSDATPEYGMEPEKEPEYRLRRQSPGRSASAAGVQALGDVPP